ncbi:hypothetical protein HK104_009091 [Borealophlyctis nickersoniae]|nr:hypothetical protein HK104_009091 [Borealophlyctis nickersoniae]
MSGGPPTSQLRQKLAALLSAASSVGLKVSFSAGVAGGARRTAQDQLDERQRKITSDGRAAKAWTVWMKFNPLSSSVEGARGRLSSELDVKGSIARKAHVGYITKANYRPPRDPVVLCHGLFGYDVLGPEALPWLQLKYWKGIADALKDLGAQVYISRVGPVASLRTRANELHTYLEANMAGKRVNLIAHSMGGLDCRYVITHLPSSNYKVNSLTTIATPHRGSSFMDFCRDMLGVGHLSHYIKKQMDDVVSAFLAKAEAQAGVAGRGTEATQNANQKQVVNPIIRAMFAPLDAPAFTNLTRDYCEAFNRLTPDRPDVHYQSYAAVTDVSVLAPLYFSHRIIKSREGVNDGLVSLESAKWGQFMGTVNCDHWELIPPRLKGLSQAVRAKKQGFDSVDFYLGMATSLHDKGF